MDYSYGGATPTAAQMIMENKKQSIKRIMVKTKIRTTGFFKRIPALAKTSGDGGQRNTDP